MSGQQGGPGWSTREVALIVVVVALAIVAGVFAFLYISLKSDYASLQSQYNALTSQYNNLESKYSALQANYTNLQSQYNSLQSQYSSLQSQYSSLQSSYSTLQSQYSSLQSQYSNVSSLLNAIVTGMQGGSSSNTTQSNDFGPGTNVYVPSGCSATVTITVTADAPIDVYVMNEENVTYLLVDLYAESLSQTPPFKWSYLYEFSGSNIQQTITLTPSYTYGGDMYIIWTYNPNNYAVHITVNAVIDHLSCSSSG